VALVDGPISAEGTAQDADGLVEEAHRLARIHRNIVVKVPMTEEGHAPCRARTKAGSEVGDRHDADRRVGRTLLSETTACHKLLPP
jgi:hypothetical protein